MSPVCRVLNAAKSRLEHALIQSQRGFHSAGPCVHFCRTRRTQDDSLHTHCANLNTLVARPITVEIWRTFFFVPLEQVPYVPSHSPCGMFTTGCRVVVLLVLQRLVTLSGTSCDSTCESFRCVFLSLDERLNIHVARSVGLTLFVTVALVFETLPQAWQKPLSSSKECVRWTPNPWS